MKNLINEKWKEAFKNRDANKRTAYELIKQRILVAEKSGQFELPLSDEQITNLIIKEVKERQDVLTFYKPTDEIYITAKAVIDELEQYLPKQMSEEEVIEAGYTNEEKEMNDISELLLFTTHQLVWTLNPVNATDKSIEFFTSDERILSISPKSAGSQFTLSNVSFVNHCAASCSFSTKSPDLILQIKQIIISNLVKIKDITSTP